MAAARAGGARTEGEGAVTSQVKTILLLGVLSAALVAFGGILGPGYLYFFTALAVLMNLGAYFFSDRIVLAMHEAHEAAPGEAPRLHAVVEELAVRAEIPKPRVFVIEDAHANAFATGRSPSRGVVAVTTGLLDLLNQRARISGDPEALASALEKLAGSAERVPGGAEPATASLFIVNPLAGAGGLMGLFSTHPPMDERVRRLRAMSLHRWRWDALRLLLGCSRRSVRRVRRRFSSEGVTL